VCLWLSGGDCLTHTTEDFSNCALRCWGAGYPSPVADATGWSYSKARGQPQGRVFTLAGSLANGATGNARRGYVNGPAGSARFNAPTGLAVDRHRNVYVADSGNNAIRLVFPNGTTVTFAGSLTGAAGASDGPALSARFNSPTGVALFYNASNSGALVVFVCDTANHVIRRIQVRRVRDGASDCVETFVCLSH
jgi:hypothetical protein